MRHPRPLPGLSQAARHVARHPLAFAQLTLRNFNRNQGVLLAGAIAYYALLSVLPLLILCLGAAGRCKVCPASCSICSASAWRSSCSRRST